MRGVRLACGALFAAALLAIAGTAWTQVLYKWTDKDGRVQYSDQPPKNFSGPVTRIEPDEKATPDAPKDGLPPAASRPGAKDDEAARRLIDLAGKRRDTRDKLEARVTAAREKLAAAKAELEAATPTDDERQVIQQRVDKANPAPGPGSGSTGGMLGMGGMMGGTQQRSNCVTTPGASGGKGVTTCPTPVPNEAYYDRVKKLEDAVKSAEQELADAQEAYRRGVD